MKGLLIILIVIFVGSCGDDKKVSNKKSVSNTTTDESANLEKVSLNLDGKWSTSCKLLDESFSLSSKRTLEVKENLFTETLNLYSDSDCTEIRTKLITSVEYVVEYKEENSTESYSLMTIIQNITFHTEDQDHVSVLNSEQYFGYDNWAFKEKKSVMGRASKPEGTAHPEAGDAFRSSLITNQESYLIYYNIRFEK